MSDRCRTGVGDGLNFVTCEQTFRLYIKPDTTPALLGVVIHLLQELYFGSDYLPSETL